MDAVIAGIPDVAHADGVLLARVEVPVLPVEERALRYRRRARERERTGDDRRCRDERKPAWSVGETGEEQEQDGEDGHPAADLAAARKQGRGPPRSHEEEDHGKQDAPGGNGERD